MDHNPPKRLSNAARKRRSSILKSHRSSRTPFSELEFNVATPGDAKSRRVSFSKHKDVAEFIKHEATTTWRSIYVEHNKSDSLGNDSDIQSQAGVVVTQNVRIFEQQFEEIETDCIDTNGKPNSRTPFNDFELTDHLTLERSALDTKVNPSTRNFQVSFLSETRSGKLDTDVILPETSGLNVDFSVIQPIEAVKDDLDEITDDIGQSNVLGGRFRGDRNMSQYIEVDLDMTHKPSEQSDMSITDTIASPKVSVQPVEERKVPVANDWTTDKENIVINPYVEVNEEDNFAINKSPEKVLVFTGKNLKYASVDADLDELEEPIIKSNKSNSSMANLLELDPSNHPSTSNHFCDPSTSTNASRIHEQSKILEPEGNVVEDSKSVIQDIIGSLSLRPTDISDINKSVLNEVAKGQRKTIVLNVDDDLPNFISETAQLGMSKSVADMDISVTNTVGVERAMYFDDLPVPKHAEVRRTILFDSKDSAADISMTQALPNILDEPEVRRQTIHFEDGNLSMTQALPVRIENVANDKRRTIVFDDDKGDLSVTRALPSKIVDGENVRSNLSINEAPRSNVLQEKRMTIVFDDNKGDLSMTQALPSKIVSEVKRNSIYFDENMGDLSLTQAVPSNVLQEKRRTIVFDDDKADLSMTQALPAKIVSEKKHNEIVVDDEEKGMIKREVLDEDKEDLSKTQTNPTLKNYAQEKLSNFDFAQEKRRTIVFDDDKRDLSITEAIQSNINLSQHKMPSNFDTQEKRRTIVFEDNEGDLSMTQAIPSNCFAQKRVSNIDTAQEKRRTIVFEDNEGDLSMTQAIPSNCFAQKRVSNIDTAQERRRTIVFKDNEGDLSMTQAIPSNCFAQKTLSNIDTAQEKRRTIVFEDNEGDLSMTQAIPSNYSLAQEKVSESNLVQDKGKTIVFEDDKRDLSMTQTSLPNISLAQKKQSNMDIAQEKRRTIILEDDKGDLSITQAMPSNIHLNKQKISTNINITKEASKSIVYEDNQGELVHAIPSNSKLARQSTSDVDKEKRRTIVFEDDKGDLSMTQAIPSNYSLALEKTSQDDIAQDKRKTVVLEGNEGNLSMTQAIPSNYSLAQEKISQDNIIQDMRKTIVFKGNEGNLSMTQAIPSNYSYAQAKISQEDIAQDKRRTIVFEDNKEVLSVTQAISSNYSLAHEKISQSYIAEEKRRTIVFEDHKGDLSITQTIPSNINVVQEKGRSNVCEDDNNKIQDKVLRDDVAVVKVEHIPLEVDKVDTNIGKSRIIYNEDITDVTMSLDASKVIVGGEREHIVPKEEKQQLSMSQEMPSNEFIVQKKKGESSNARDLSLNVPQVELKEEEDIFMSQEDLSISKAPSKIDYGRRQTIATEGMPKVHLSNVKMAHEKRKTIQCDEIELAAISLPMLPHVKSGEQNKSKTYLGDKDLDRSIEPIDVDRSTPQDIPNKHVSEEMNKTQEELMVYQTITTASNKTITQSIRKVNEENTSIINQLQESKSKYNLLSKKCLELYEDYAESNKSTESHKENPVHVIFAVRKDEDIMSSSDQDVSVCVAHVKGNNSNFNEFNKLSDKSIQKMKHDRSAFLVDQDSAANRSSQISPRKSLIKEILRIDDVSMEIDFDGEVTCGTQTDFKKSSDSIIRIIDDGVRENGVDANQDIELGAISTTNQRICSQGFTVHNEKEEMTNKTATIYEADEPEIKSLSLPTNNAEYLIDSVSEYIDDMYVEKHLSKLQNRKSLYEEMKPIFNPSRRQSVVLSREEMLSNISMAQAVLQKSCANIDNTVEDSTVEDTPEPVHSLKSYRVSNDVVKVLKFDDSIVKDESVNRTTSKKSSNQINKSPCSKENSRMNTGELSPLRKNTSVETEIRDANKSYVIPPYLDRVTDNLKEIMNDLVKPMVDVPIKTEESKPTKTVKLQANIQTSSQVDMVDEAIKRSHKSHSKKVHRKSVVSERTITFDITNPLNNISIPSLIHTEFHRYNPIVSKDVEMNVDQWSSDEEIPVVETRNVLITTEDKKANVTVGTQSDENGVEVKKEPNVKEVDVNTIIAMKSNYELLAERSSLTITEDNTNKEKRKRLLSPNKLLKRNDKTPKPLKKIQRKSNSPLGISTVNRLITECYGGLANEETDFTKKTKSVEVCVRMEDAEVQIKDNKDLEVDTSESDPEKKSDVPTVNKDVHVGKGGNDLYKNASNGVTFAKRATDYYLPDVGKLEDELKKLPYMGTNLCSWDTNKLDEWSFLLLRSRLRLIIKFVHNQSTHNICVDPERKIQSINVDIVKCDENAIAYQTVLLTQGAIQNYLNTHKLVIADQIPDLIQRVTTICWQARRWGQVMESTRLRLAFKVDEVGVISLKVANISLRSIWEVTLAIDKSSLPLATDVHVTNCLTQESMVQQEVDAIVNKIPKDWGHVPNTVWKLFKYLKNKNTNNSIVLGLI